MLWEVSSHFPYDKGAKKHEKDNYSYCVWDSVIFDLRINSGAGWGRQHARAALLAESLCGKINTMSGWSNQPLCIPQEPKI